MHCSFQATDKLISWPLTVAKLIHHVPVMIFYGYYLVGRGTVEMRMLDILAAAVIHNVRSKWILNSNVAKSLWLFSSRIALYVYTVLYTNLETDLTTEWTSRITQYLSLRWVSGRYRKLFYRSTAVAYEARIQGKKLGENQCIKQTKQNKQKIGNKMHGWASRCHNDSYKSKDWNKCQLLCVCKLYTVSQQNSTVVVKKFKYRPSEMTMFSWPWVCCNIEYPPERHLEPKFRKM